MIIFHPVLERHAELLVDPVPPLLHLRLQFGAAQARLLLGAGAEHTEVLLLLLLLLLLSQCCRVPLFLQRAEICRRGLLLSLLWS